MSGAAEHRAGRASLDRATLRVRDLTKRFGELVAVDRVSFDVEEDEIVCLVGPSGCGKSTLLRMIAGLTKPDAGEVWLAGRQLEGPGVSVPPERRRVGIVFQEPALFPNLTVAENVAFGLRRAERRSGERVAELLELVGLEDLADRYPHELSGGERQRVALARALAPDPLVMLLDEPFANLDQNLRVRVRGDVVRVLRKSQIPAVLVTHDQGEAMAIADRLIVMRSGKIEQVGSPAEVFHHPENKFVAEFLGEADFLPATVESGKVVTELGTVPLPSTSDHSSENVVMMIRPDDVVVAPAGSSSRGDRCRARVVASEFQGGWFVHRLLLPSGRTVRARSHHASGLREGDDVEAGLDAHVEPVLFGDGEQDPS